MFWRRRKPNWTNWISSKARSPRNWAWRSRKIKRQILGSLNRLIPQHHELIFAQRKHRIGAAFVVREFNLIDSIAQRLNHRADLSSRQPARRNIFGERNNIQW